MGRSERHESLSRAPAQPGWSDSLHIIHHTRRHGILCQESSGIKTKMLPFSLQLMNCDPYLTYDSTMAHGNQAM